MLRMKRFLSINDNFIDYLEYLENFPWKEWCAASVDAFPKRFEVCSLRKKFSKFQ